MSVNIPRAGGVPGIPGPPDWLSAPPTGKYRLDDVRWLGAAKTDFGSGAGASNGLRIAHDVQGAQEYIYLSFRAAFVPHLSDQFDFVWIGLQRTGSNKAMVIRLQVHGPTFTQAGPPPDTNAPVQVKSIQAFTRLDTASNWTPVSPTPSWIDANARVWLQDNDDVPADPNRRWAVQIRIPAAAAGDIAAAAGPNVGADFRMWYVIQGTGKVGSAFIPIILADYRVDGVATSEGDLLDGIYPSPFAAPNPWDQFLLTSGPAAFGGVAIHGNGSSDIRVSNVYGEGTKIDHGGANTFIARPRNYRPGPVGGVDHNAIAAGDISATFRIANWGSVGGNPSQVNWSSGTWDLLPGQPPGVASSLPIPTLAAGTNPPAAQPIALSASLPLTSGRSLHQCVYVTLSGSGLQFLNDSAFQNMDFDEASVVEREAEISVVDVSPQPADALLAVETINMPRNLPSGTDEGQFFEARMAQLMERGGALAEKLQRVRRVLGRGEADPKRRLQTFVDALSAADVSQDELELFFPTYRVHCYHDTGERVKNASGEQVPVYREQSSFGFYVYHEGPITGWQTSIDGATRTDEALYQLAMPATGKATIRVRVQAVTPEERRIPEDPIAKPDGPTGGGTTPDDGSGNPGCLGALGRLFRSSPKRG